MTAIPPFNANPKGQNLSFWMSRNMTNAESYPPLRGTSAEQPFDVIVIGGAPHFSLASLTLRAAGITGLTAALNLKRAGRRVAVLEHHRVGTGTSGTSCRDRKLIPPLCKHRASPLRAHRQ